MANIGKISSYTPAWQNFDPSKAKLTKNQKEAIKRKELQDLCRKALEKEKMKYAFYQVNRSYLSETSRTSMSKSPDIRAISRFV